MRRFITLCSSLLISVSGITQNDSKVLETLVPLDIIRIPIDTSSCVDDAYVLSAESFKSPMDRFWILKYTYPKKRNWVILKFLRLMKVKSKDTGDPYYFYSENFIDNR